MNIPTKQVVPETIQKKGNISYMHGFLFSQSFEITEESA